MLKNNTKALTNTITNDNNLVYKNERVSSTLYALFNPFNTIANAFVERITVIQKPKIAIKPPFVKNQTSFKTVSIRFITSPGITCCKNTINGFIKECLPSQPKSAVKNNINGKIPITSMNPISAAMPKKSFSTTEFIIFLNVLNLIFTV